MKKRTKTWLIIACVAAMLAASVAGTLAYLTDTATNVNTFTVGKVDIRLDEAVVDANGVPQGKERTEKGNEYHLIPGQTYVKDPTVTVVKGSDESYIRILVTINKISELKAIFGKDFLPESFVKGWDKTAWLSTSVTDNGDNTATYEFRWHKTVAAPDTDVALDALFDSFTLPGDVSGEQLKTIADLEITVVANAIQKAGFDNADAAWKAFADEMGK